MASKKAAKGGDWKPYLPIAISCFALIVSVSSTAISFLSYRQSREFSEIAIQPILHTAGPLFQSPSSQIVIVNRGSGAAIVSSGMFSIDGQQVRGRAIASEFSGYQSLYNETNSTDYGCTLDVGSIYREMLIEVGQTVVLFASKGECPQVMYMPFLSRISFEIEYRSLAGLTQVMRFEVKSPDEAERIMPFL
jgi:hypothetical protein